MMEWREMFELCTHGTLQLGKDYLNIIGGMYDMTFPFWIEIDANYVCFVSEKHNGVHISKKSNVFLKNCYYAIAVLEVVIIILHSFVNLYC